MLFSWKFHPGDHCWGYHDDVIKWKHFPRKWFVRGIHRSPVNSPHKGQWRGALMFTLICARINGWVNTREAGDLRRYRPHYDVIVMIKLLPYHWSCHRRLFQDRVSVDELRLPDLQMSCRDLLHLPPDKMAAISQRHFETHFLELKGIDFDQNFTEVCSQWSD